MEINRKARHHARLLMVAAFLVVATASASAQTAPPESHTAARNNDPVTKDFRPADTRENSEIDLLKAQLAAQQDELAALRKAVKSRAS